MRIAHFGAYVRTEDGWQLSTIVDGFFTDDQFQEWYGVDGEWLMPGEARTDQDNYGAGAECAYFYETKTGGTGLAASTAPE